MTKEQNLALIGLTIQMRLIWSSLCSSLVRWNNNSESELLIASITINSTGLLRGHTTTTTSWINPVKMDTLLHFAGIYCLKLLCNLSLIQFSPGESAGPTDPIKNPALNAPLVHQPPTTVSLLCLSDCSSFACALYENYPKTVSWTGARHEMCMLSLANGRTSETLSCGACALQVFNRRPRGSFFKG